MAVRKIKFNKKANTAKLIGGQVISNIHPERVCTGRACVIHNPSKHLMSGWNHNFRIDRGLMERVCPHGIGHPDPDDLVWRADKFWGVHGCDGCCTGNYPFEQCLTKRIGE